VQSHQGPQDTHGSVRRALFKCSPSRRISLLPTTPFRSLRPLTRSTPLSTCTSAHNQRYFSTHQHSRTNPAPAHLTFRSPIALSSYHPNPTHDSSAPRRRSTLAERPSSCRRDAISRWKAASPPSLHGLSSAAGAVHKNTVGRPSVRSLGVVAQEVRMPAAPSSPCPRPRPVSGAGV
jgi:hypothetical protein